MNYISLIQSIFQTTLDLKVHFLDSPLLDISIDMNFRKSLFDSDDDYVKKGFSDFLKLIKEKTIYIMEDNYKMHYVFLKVKNGDTCKYIVAGPYIVQDITNGELLKISNINSIAWDRLNFLKNFYGILPVITDLKVIRAISSLIKNLYDDEEYKLEYISSINSDYMTNDVYSDNVKEDMKMIKARYNIENELLKNVENGDFKKSAESLSKLFSLLPSNDYTLSFEDNKNSLIIANVLLRKTVEKTGIHPYYIDILSRKYAKNISKCKRVSELDNLVFDMAKQYCKLVRDFSIDNSYSPTIKDAIYYINSNYCNPISLKEISEHLNINKNYLSTLFKKETGITITDFILNRKMKEANNLIESTNLLISDIASLVGIDDLSYFTKVYKKHFNMTPTQYKSHLKENLK